MSNENKGIIGKMKFLSYLLDRKAYWKNFQIKVIYITDCTRVEWFIFVLF